MVAAVERNDPYMWFARRAGLAPDNATKTSHAPLRDKLKVFLLGVGYGMTAHGITANLGVSLEAAEDLLAQHKRLFPVYWRWAEGLLYRSIGDRLYRTRFGWPLWITARLAYKACSITRSRVPVRIFCISPWSGWSRPGSTSRDCSTMRC